MEFKQLTLKRGKDSSLLRYHPWIFSGAIAAKEQGITDGDIVKVYTHDGKFIAVGHYQTGSIAVRVLSFADEEIDYGFWRSRLQSALNLRRDIGLTGLEDNNTFRLVHGEGDNMPALIVDVYGKTAVVQAHSAGMHHARHEMAKAIQDVTDGMIEAVYYKSGTTLPFAEELNASDGFLVGKSNDNVALEYGLKFHIDWLNGQKTGFFVDQRENRRLVGQYARNRRVLNMFCYTGGFSAYALRGGADTVHSVDSSAKAIDLTRENIALNFPDCKNHYAYAEDAFKFLQNMQSGTYDFIILDPPAFAKHLDAVRSALRGYQKLNAKAFEKIAPGGIMFTFSCSQAINKEQFRLAVFSAAAQTGRKVRILHQLHQPADHPVNIYHPEGEYLKGLALYVE